MAVYHIPLRVKLITSVGAVVLAVVGALTLAFRGQQRDVLRALQVQAVELTGAIAQKQQEATTSAMQAQRATVLAGLNGKGETLANLLARQALTAVLTEDQLQLDALAESACRDQDLVACVFLGGGGKPVSSFRNSKHPVARPCATDGDLAGALARMALLPGAVRVTVPVCDDVGTAQGQVVVVLDSNAALQRSEGQASANAQLGEVGRMVGDMRGAIERRIVAAEAAIETLAAEAVGAGMVLSLAGALLIAWNITRPLRRARQLLEAVAAGDLRQRLAVGARDDIGLMAIAANGAVEALRTTVEGLRTSSTTLAGAATELSEVSDTMRSGAAGTATRAHDTAARTSKIHAAVQSSAAASEEISASIQDVENLALKAHTVVDASRQQALAATRSIERLHASAGQVGQIIELISSVAFQTNLLALNAAIEAARAGEAGRGFAVVADEVKALAARTAMAAQDIQQKLQAIQGDAGTSVDGIRGIHESIDRVCETFGHIKGAVTEQSRSATQIANALSQIAGDSSEVDANAGVVAEQADRSSRGAEDMHASSAALSHLARDMDAIVRRFTL